MKSSTPVPPDGTFWIAPNISAGKWCTLYLNRATDPDYWSKAVEMFHQRLYSRWLAPIKAIENHPDIEIQLFSGFAILALDCLIIETLNQFYKGEKETQGGVGQAFQNFFKQSSHFPGFTKKVSITFYDHFRNGLLHQAQTKGASKIRIDTPDLVKLVDPANTDPNLGLVINRILFHQALLQEIEDYEENLKNPTTPKHHILRTNFEAKMNFIAK